MRNIIRDWWWAKQREIDLDVLWPQCKAKADSLEAARSAFALHAFNTPAWIRHYKEELASVISKLE